MRILEKLLAACICLVLLLCCVPAALAADGADCPHCDDDSITWKEWKDGDATPTSGHYVLASETVTVSGSKSLQKGKELVIDLNGNTLQMDPTVKSRMFLVNDGAKLVFMDSSAEGTGEVIGNQSNANIGIAQIYSGNMDIYGGTFLMTATSTVNKGGLFRVTQDGTKSVPVVNIKGGTFYGATATEGGIISMTNATLNISGGTFHPGTAGSGDAICVDNKGASVNISGDAKIYGGVEVNAVGSLFISGKPTIQKTEGGSDYGIKLPEGKIIMVDALEEDARIDITGTGVVAQGFASPVAAAEAARSIFVADETGKVVKSRGLELLVTENSTQNTFDCPHCDDENVTWTKWDGTSKPATGHYYLEDNAEMTKNASYDSSSSEDIVLNLNGYTLSKKSAGRMFQLQGSSKLTIMDSSADKTGAVVSNNASSANHGMIAMAYAADTSVTVYGGNFYCGTVNSGTKNGGLLYASPGAVYISGGEFWGTSAQNGGAVAAKNGTLEITGGIFHPGTASIAGDTVYAEGTANVTIGGTAVIEGGVHVEQIASFTVEGTPQIQKEIGGSAYSLKTATMVTLGTLEDGAKIGITSMSEQTVFTAELADHAAAQAAQKFFCSDDDYKIITAEAKALSCIECEDAPADSADKAQLNALYTGTTAYHGEMHDHSDSGGRSDGHVTLDVWKEQMAQLKMDFAAIVDHHQASHMRLDLWDNTIFIGGSEAQTKLTDMESGKNTLHFNMIFSQPEQMEEVLYQFYDYDQTTGFDYIDFPRATMEELAEAVKKAGGMFTHVHPKFDGYVQSDNPLDYWFGNDTGLEVWCSDKNRDMNDPANQAGYKLWTDLLALGKRVWATAGNDGHRNPSTKSLTTVYAEEKHADSLISHLRIGDSTCGNIGIRMSIGSAKTGAQTFFKEGDRLVLSVGDFHESLDASHIYRLDLFDDRGDVHRQMISSTEENWFAFDVDTTAKFYRAEVYDVTDRVQIAIGNPIWNSAFQSPLSFAGASLTLEHNLAVNYKVDTALFENVGYTDPYVVVELNGVKTKVSSYTVKDDRYVFSFRNIAPNQMNDTIQATLYATYDGVEYASATREYSVAEYCYSMLDLYAADEYAELRTLLVDLLHYGAASQTYTGYRTDAMVNASLTDAQLLWGTSADPSLDTVLDTAYKTVENPTAKWKGAGLHLQESVSMRLRFTAESIDGLSVKIESGANTWTISSDKFLEEDGVYYVYFTGLDAGQMRQSVYLTICDGDTPVSNTVCYSIESYAYEKQNSTIAGLPELVKAMMKYGDSAYAYVH